MHGLQLAAITEKAVTRPKADNSNVIQQSICDSPTRDAISFKCHSLHGNDAMPSDALRRVVVTGVGLVTPLGVGMF